ncbi:MAG: DUF4198 domain-containing protein [Mariprofundaceae bacterium]|nr:DUF4198 domain-containing protein [Mariprofundaceae bacterium]
MKATALIGVTLAVALCSFTAEAAMHWAPAPVKHSGGHGGHDRNAAKPFMLVEGDGASLSLINPTLNATPLTAEQNRVAIKPTGMGNYHALVATHSTGELHESAIRYVYMSGKSSGESPSLLISHEKSALEVEPAPLAREHWRYYSATDAIFILRFRGKPLADAVVTLATDNGTTGEFRTDTGGRLIVPLPEDFSMIKPGRAGNKPSEFMVTASHSDGGQTYITTFSSAYSVNPKHWQSTELGLATVLGGMLIGGFIAFRTRQRKGK